MRGQAGHGEDVNRRLLRILSKLHDVPMPKPELNKVEQRDFVAGAGRAQIFRRFPVGRFYVYGSHVEEPPPVGSIPIKVDAGAAFGSGEHGTTRCCMEKRSTGGTRKRGTRKFSIWAAVPASSPLPPQNSGAAMCWRWTSIPWRCA